MSDRPPDPDLERRLRRLLDDPAQDEDAWRAPVDRAVTRTASLPQRRRAWSGIAWRPALAAAGGATVLAAAVLALLVVLTGQPRNEVGSAPTPEPGRTARPGAPLTDRVIASFPVPVGEPVGTAIGEGALWIATLDGTVRRYDPESGAELSRSQLPGTGCGPIVIGAGHAWTRACLSGPGDEISITWLVQLDETDGRVVREIRFETPIGVQPAVQGGMLWVITDQRSGELATVDPNTGAVEVRLTAGGRASHLLAAFGRLWVSLPAEGAVARIDPETGDRADVAVGGRPGSLAAAGGRVWVGSGTDPWLDAIDPERGQVVATSVLGGATGQIIGEADAVWVLTSTRIERLDPASAEVVDAVQVGTHVVSFEPQFSGQTYALALGDDAWYVPPSGEIHRLLR